MYLLDASALPLAEFAGSGPISDTRVSIAPPTDNFIRFVRFLDHEKGTTRHGPAGTVASRSLYNVQSLRAAAHPQICRGTRALTDKGRTSIQAVLGGAGSKCDGFDTPVPHRVRSRVADYSIRRRAVLTLGRADAKPPERLARSADATGRDPGEHEHMFAPGYDRFAGRESARRNDTRRRPRPMNANHPYPTAILATQRPVGMFSAAAGRPDSTPEKLGIDLRNSRFGKHRATLEQCPRRVPRVPETPSIKQKVSPPKKSWKSGPPHAHTIGDHRVGSFRSAPPPRADLTRASANSPPSPRPAPHFRTRSDGLIRSGSH